MNKQFDVSILFLIFKRSDTTSRVFEAIKDIKPCKLFVAADGPRNKEEEKECKKTRAIIKVDWDCEVKTLYRDKNLGLRNAIPEAINWFFDNVEEGIILEDDCLPHSEFFSFCRDMLSQYRNNNKIMHIGGANFQFGRKVGKESYYFSNNVHIWGWATWRRSWQLYDVNMKEYPEFCKKKIISKIYPYNPIVQFLANHMYRQVFTGKLNTWDTQWGFAVQYNSGLSIIPNTNLISNIGFGKVSTNTFSAESICSNIQTDKIYPLMHPKKIETNKRADCYSIRKCFFDALKNYIKRKLLFR